MNLDPDNSVNRRCAEGINFEGRGDLSAAATCYHDAWSLAERPVEKLIAAHYVARVQASVAEKLQWDLHALKLARDVDSGTIAPLLPSLRLNAGKCYEDLRDFVTALHHYETGLRLGEALPSDGYSDMIRRGLQAGLARVRALQPRQTAKVTSYTTPQP